MRIIDIEVGNQQGSIFENGAFIGFLRDKQARKPPGYVPVGSFNIFSFQVAGIPTLDDDQPVGIRRQDGVPRPFGSESPVGGGVAAAPAGTRRGIALDVMRLVVQVRADDGRRGEAEVRVGAGEQRAVEIALTR